MLRLQKIRQTLRRLHEDERGAEGLEKLLIIAAIILPLLGLLILFRNTISEWISSVWTDVSEDGNFTEPNITSPTG